jgi:hypothetical protein
MDRLREAAVVLKIYPKLKLGEKLPGGGVKPTGSHKVKITAEPTTVMVNKGGIPTKHFKFIVEENGQNYKWLVPITNKEGTEAHYLVERLMDVQVGDELILEMKKQGARNFIEVRRANEPERVEEEEVEVDDETAAEVERQTNER